MILVFTIVGVLTLLLLIHRVGTYWQAYQRNRRDSVEECHNHDALFGFAIRSHLDRVARRGHLSGDNILDHIVRIGLYDWSGLDNQGGGKQPPIQIRYTAVMGMQLWKRIDVLSDRVSLL